MKTYSWIVALLLALSFVFVSCSGDDGNGIDDGNDGSLIKGGIENPVVEGASFLRMSGRTEDYYTIDILSAKGNILDRWTADTSHTITVYGKGEKSTGDIRFAQTDSPYDRYSPNFNTKDDGSFTMERVFAWAEISAAGQNIRIQLAPKHKTVYIYEITIVAGGTTVYKLSTDVDIQNVDNGGNPFAASTDNPPHTTWLAKAGSPAITVIVPGEEEGELPPEEITPPPEDGILFSLDKWLEENEIGDGAIASHLPSPLQKAGEPTVTVSGGDLVISGRTVDWHAVDLKTDSFDFDYSRYDYELTVIGSTVADSVLKAGQTDDPWDELKRVTTTANTPVTFTEKIPQKNTKGVDFGNIRIQTTGTENYTITGIILKAVEK